MTALGLQKAGYRTILAEKQKSLGSHYQKIDITEEIGLNQILKKYKIKPEITSNKSYWYAGEECFEFKSKIKDLFFLRGKQEKSLEKQLFKQAEKLGVESKFCAIVKFRDNNITLNGEEIVSKKIIGADGINSIVTKYCNPIEKIKIYEGYGQSFNKLNIPIGETHVFFEQREIPGGYLYSGRAPNLATIFLGGKNKPNKTHFDKIKNTNPKIKKIIGKKIGTDLWGKGIISNINKRVYKNIILVGDAARVADPLFLYGVRPALISADLCVKTIIDNFENGIPLEKYDILLREQLLKDYYLARIARNTLEKTNQNDIEFIIKNLDYINKTIGLDGISNKPRSIIEALIIVFIRNPYNSTKLSFKVIKSLFESL